MPERLITLIAIAREADDAWQNELVRVYGGHAALARYTEAGRATEFLKVLRTAFQHAQCACRNHPDSAFTKGCDCDEKHIEEAASAAQEPAAVEPEPIAPGMGLMCECGHPMAVHSLCGCQIVKSARNVDGCMDFCVCMVLGVEDWDPELKRTIEKSLWDSPVEQPAAEQPTVLAPDYPEDCPF